jgi:hypothetical protein
MTTAALPKVEFELSHRPRGYAGSALLLTFNGVRVEQDEILYLPDWMNVHTIQTFFAAIETTYGTLFWRTGACATKASGPPSNSIAIRDTIERAVVYLEDLNAKHVRRGLVFAKMRAIAAVAD